VKAPNERSTTGNLLVALRKARGFTNGKKAAEHVRQQTQVVGLADSVWASYESGGRPMSAKHRAAIESVFGPLGPDDTATPQADLSALISALTGMVTEMRRQNDRADAAERQLDVLGDTLKAMATEVRDLRAALRAHEEAAGPHGAPTPGDEDVPPSHRGGPPKRSQAAAR
jgi:hypothetical protein